MEYVKTFEEFLIHGKSSNKILIFDIDDTLIKSDAKVFVKKNGVVVKKLDTQEYNTYKLKRGESYSFEEFDDLNIMLDAELTPYFKTMEREYRKGVHISIITARSGARMIHDFFMKKANIDIHPKLIFTTGDDPSAIPVSEKKAKCIRTLVKYGYDTLVFFDDNIDNLNDVREMGKSLGVTCHTIHVS